MYLSQFDILLFQLFDIFHYQHEVFHHNVSKGNITVWFIQSRCVQNSINRSIQYLSSFWSKVVPYLPFSADNKGQIEPRTQCTFHQFAKMLNVWNWELLHLNFGCVAGIKKKSQQIFWFSQVRCFQHLMFISSVFNQLKEEQSVI